MMNVHLFSDKLYIYPCRYNYRTDHCMYKNVCKDAEWNGISVIHGSRRIFHSDSERSFKAIYQAFEQVTIASKESTL